MKKYNRPILKEENIILEDIIALSNGGATSNGSSGSISDLFPLTK